MYTVRIRKVHRSEMPIPVPVSVWWYVRNFVRRDGWYKTVIAIVLLIFAYQILKGCGVV